ncbi:uncharacterized protein LOC126900061 [Daktulosphaira vitifoliae]|uniref:uncharacterized protein LOC126900061 n=1 Tax=Daktulosphaira vitifoliae TaxID=58002 RepID=UPI0021A9EAFB|nr:uncharacterized protein LOC126900061 [Daktulosphaira vitifoliae]
MTLNEISDHELKMRLANFGVFNPITNSTRNILIKKLLNLEKTSKYKQIQSTSVEYMEIMSDENLRIRLSKFGITCPITDSTRSVLKNKLYNLETELQERYTNHEYELMDTSSNDMNEYEIQNRLLEDGSNLPKKRRHN